MQEYLVGMATVDITPPLGLQMAGYGERQGTAIGVHDPLRAVAVVFDNRNGQKSAICAVDVCEVDPVLTVAVRRRAATYNAIHPTRLMLAATHTHSGPSLESANILNQRWRRQLEDLLVQAIMTADVARRPARIGVAHGCVEGVGGNRRDPINGPVDREVVVMRIDDLRAGKTMGVIVNHACHATTLDLKNLLYTADYPGAVRNYVAENIADRPQVMFLNGACGDINPGGYSAEDSALGRPIPNRTFERAQAIGAIIGREVVRLASQMRLQETFDVFGGNLPLRLPLRACDVPAALENELAAAMQRVQEAQAQGLAQAEIDRRRLEVVYARCALSFARRYFETPNGELETELQGLVVGDAAFLGIPGELFNELGSAIKRQSPFATTFLIGYANGDIGYFPTVEAFQQGGYEVRTSMFGGVAIKRLVGWSNLFLKALKQSIQAGAGKAPATAAGTRQVRFRRLRPAPHPVTAARFPAVDFHMHYSGHRFDAAENLRTMQATNVRYAVNLVGDNLKPPLLAPFALPPPINERVIVFGGLDFRRIDEQDWPDYVRQQLDADMRAGARGLKIYKELGLIYRDYCGNLIMPDDKRLTSVWQAAAERRLPVLYHIADPLRSFAPLEGDYAALREMDDTKLRWRWGAPGYPTHAELLQCQENLALANPQTTFIFAHLGAMEADLPGCAALLERCPNVYVDVAARLIELGKQPVSARELFVKHADRILWGTDFSCLNEENGYYDWFQFFETRDEAFVVRQFGVEAEIYGLGLPDEVLRKIYGENAARLLGIKL